MQIFILLLDGYSLIVFGTVLASWMQLPSNHPITNFRRGMTEPLLEPIRRYLPDMGGLDFSAFVLLIGIRLVRGVLLSGTMAP